MDINRAISGEHCLHKYYQSYYIIVPSIFFESCRRNISKANRVKYVFARFISAKLSIAHAIDGNEHSMEKVFRHFISNECLGLHITMLSRHVNVINRGK